MTEKLNNYQIAAKLRAEKRKVFDPSFYKRSGSVGGRAKVPTKGVGSSTPEERKALSKKALDARWGEARKAKKDLEDGE